MSGKLPRIEFNYNNDNEFSKEESVSPLDFTYLSTNDDKWLSDELPITSLQSSSHNSSDSLNIIIPETYEAEEIKNKFNFTDNEFSKEEFVAPLVTTFLSTNAESSIAPSQSSSHDPSDYLSNPFPETAQIVKKPIHSSLDLPNLTERLSVLAPEPLLPNKFHPLCFCYRHPDDYDHHQPRVYCEGIPEDDDIVIYSEVQGNVTWMELKSARPDTPNLHKLFPLLQWWQHNSEEEEHQISLFDQEEETRKEIEAIKIATENEILRLDKLYPRPNDKAKEIEKPKSPNLKRSENFVHNSTAQHKTTSSPRDRPNLKQTKQFSSTINRRDQKNTVRALNKVMSLSDDCLRAKKIQRPILFYTPEDRMYFEVHGCTKFELRERKAQEKRMKAGVRF